jgi:hypothetical protein
MSYYVSFVDHNKVFLVDTVELSKLSILVFRNEITNFLLSPDKSIMTILHLGAFLSVSMYSADPQVVILSSVDGMAKDILLHLIPSSIFVDDLSPLQSGFDLIVVDFRNPQKVFLVI